MLDSEVFRVHGIHFDGLHVEAITPVAPPDGQQRVLDGYAGEDGAMGDRGVRGGRVVTLVRSRRHLYVFC